MKLNKKTVLPFALITIILCGLSFYAGTQYSTIKKSNERAQFAGGQPFGGAMVGTPRTGTAMRGGGSGMVSGEILSVDAKSITVKDQTGGSKIVFLGASSEVMKSVTGTIADLAVGTNIITNGTPNADGSITATTIQIRPEGQGFGAPMGTPKAQ
jgi:hypothetical protein